MKYKNLGNTGLRVSRVCLGCMSYGDPNWREWTLDEDAARPFIRKALELGVNFFDTADVYSNGASEEVLGRAIKDFADRDDIILATKTFLGTHGGRRNRRGLSRKHIMAAVDASLKRLQTDFIDLYQIHRFDPWTPAEETMQALDDVVRAGKVRYLGASSMWAWQFAKMLYTADLHGWTRFVSMQPHYNLLYREEEREMLPLCADQRIGVIPWSPLARGLVARRPGTAADTPRGQSDGQFANWYGSDADEAIVAAVSEVADQRGTRPAQVALAWVLGHPAITAPIVGATKLDHLEAAAAATEIELSADERATLEAPYQPRAVAGHQ